jgi:hypothetical protein
VIFPAFLTAEQVKRGKAVRLNRGTTSGHNGCVLALYESSGEEDETDCPRLPSCVSFFRSIGG